ncbi:hypothetical protein [Rheinheimera sp.]|uniref:hypothetical protein n=1 Tax=Rheinheimera sp. TaxID=1869214 RepID=UPI0025DD6CCF|nr:hypothetical protein [Rheinheimera sp.]
MKKQGISTLLGMLVLLSGCSTVPQQKDLMVNQLDGSLAQLQVDTKQLHQRLQRLTADKSCQQSTQCKVLPVGHRPCGGPEQYMVYSSKSTDEKLLAITNDRYKKLKQEQQQRLGLRSTCQIVPEPVAACQQQQCSLLP